MSPNPSEFLAEEELAEAVEADEAAAEALTEEEPTAGMINELGDDAEAAAEEEKVGLPASQSSSIKASERDLTFEPAMLLLRESTRIRRASWRQGVHLFFVPESHSANGCTAACIHLVSPEDNPHDPPVHHRFGAEDVCAFDWEVFRFPEKEGEA